MKIATPEGPLDVVPVKVAHANEAFNTYDLEDGSVITLRTPVAAVYRIEQPDQFGQPQYRVLHQTMITVVPATQPAPSGREN